METTALIQCEQLVCNNGDHGRSLAPLDFSAGAGSVISLIGPDHDSAVCCLQTLAGVIEAEAGRLSLAGRETTRFTHADWVRIRTEFAYVSADTRILSAANACQNLMLPALYHNSGEFDQVLKQAQQLLQAINAGDNLELLPAYLKKEQRYKIAVARALMLEPRALLLNNPFGALEMASLRPFQQFLLERVRHDGLLLIVATHDTKFARAHSDQIIYLSPKQLLKFDQTQRIENCDDPEVIDYLTTIS